MQHTFRRALLAAAMGIGVAAAAGAGAQEIKIGALATLEGPFAVPGQDSMRGVELALSEVNYTIAGKKVILSKVRRTPIRTWR